MAEDPLSVEAADVSADVADWVSEVFAIEVFSVDTAKVSVAGPGVSAVDAVPEAVVSVVPDSDAAPAYFASPSFMSSGISSPFTV